MSDLSTNRRHRPRGRTAVSTLAIAALLLVGNVNAAHAGDAVATPSPAPSVTSPAPTDSAPAPKVPAATKPAPTPKAPATTSAVEPKSVKRATPTIERKAMATQTTGFSLRYAFEPGMYPSNPQLSYDGSTGPGAAAKASNWAEGDVRYLQWDYAMPQNGGHTMVFTAQLIDTGKATDYSVKYTSRVNRSGGSIAVSTDCVILYNGTAIDLGSQSPYSCSGGNAQGASGTVLATTQTNLQSWAGLTGDIQVSNVDDSAPKISLANGVFGTTNQFHRIIMNGSTWYPFDSDGVAQPAPQYATISNGESLSWSTSALNLPHKQAEVSSHAQAYFIYEILLGGESTGYWLKGSGDNYKWYSWWYPTAKCEIYAGNPNNGKPPITHATPFTCEPSEREGRNYKDVGSGTMISWDAPSKTNFVVQMAAVDTLHTQTDAQDRGVKDACGVAEGACVITPGKKTRLPEITSVPQTSKGSTVVTNDSGGEGDFAFDFTFSREVTNTLEQMFGVTTKVKVGGSFMGSKSETSIEFTSETTFGYDISNGFEVAQKVSETLPFWSTANFYYTDVYDQYSTDVYFFGESDIWYRATGATITVPVPSKAPTASATGGPLVEPDPAGGTIPGLVYQCTWMEQRADKIISKVIGDYDTAHQILPQDRKASAYAEPLNTCSVPASWSKLEETAFSGAERHLKWQVLQELLEPLTEH